MIQGVVEKIKEVYFAGQDSSMDFFMKNWEESKEAKAGLIELLGGEELVIEINMDEEAIEGTFPNCFSKIKQMLRYIEPEDYMHLTATDIIKNTFNGRKLSRYIIKNKAKISSVSYIIERDSVNRELSVYTRNLELFFKTLYEKIAALKSEKVVLSANYIDILSAGNVSGENSCYAQSIFRDKMTNHGAYSLAPHTFAQDGQTLIAYVLRDNGKKFSKRVLVHINGARDKFVIGRKYGNWGESSLKALYRVIEGLLGEPDTSGWYLKSEIGSYFENQRIDFRYTENDVFNDVGRPFYSGDTASYYFYKKNSSSRFRMTIPALVGCISCGCEHSYPEGSGMCYDCAVKFRRSRRCSYCDSERNLQVFNGVAYCPECAHEVRGLPKTCSQCDGSFTEAGFYYDDRVWCSTCYNARMEEIREERRRISEERDRRERERLEAYHRASARFTSGTPGGRVNTQWREITEEMARVAGLLEDVQIGQAFPYAPIVDPDPVRSLARRRSRITGDWLIDEAVAARQFPPYTLVDRQEEPTW